MSNISTSAPDDKGVLRFYPASQNQPSAEEVSR